MVSNGVDQSRTHPEPVRVVALATFPLEAAATRFRVAQFIPSLAARGVEVTLLPFLTAADYRRLYDLKSAAGTALRLVLALLRRLLHLPRILSADVLFIQREAMLVGPPLLEWLAVRLARVPMVLDLDDATWMPIRSPVYGRLAALLKWGAKTDLLMRWAHTVICGNAAIAEHARAAGARSVILPTIVDTSSFRPGEPHEPSVVPVLGWIGTHSTARYLDPLLPLLDDLAITTPFRLRIIGSGRDSFSLRGVEADVLPWQLEREVRDIQSFDVGIYPLPEDAWAAAKSGLKSVQYLACGVPFVASPVGIVGEIGEPGVTHLEATTPEQWRQALERLLRNAPERRAMGAAGRRYALEHFALPAFAGRLEAVLRAAASGVDAETCG